jgi:hypothetical protein
MIAMKINLTPRQRALRRLLSAYRWEWMGARDIYEAMRSSPRAEIRYEWDGRTKFHGDVGRMIYADVTAINASGAYDKIIVSDKALGYKLATKEEYEKYSKSRWRSLKKSIGYQAGLDKQAGLDGQAIIQFPSVPDGEEVHEVFVRGAKR